MLTKLMLSLINMPECIRNEDDNDGPDIDDVVEVRPNSWAPNQVFQSGSA